MPPYEQTDSLQLQQFHCLRGKSKPTIMPCIFVHRKTFLTPSHHLSRVVILSERTEFCAIFRKKVPFKENTIFHWKCQFRVSLYWAKIRLTVSPFSNENQRNCNWKLERKSWKKRQFSIICLNLFLKWRSSWKSRTQENLELHSVGMFDRAYLLGYSSRSEEIPLMSISCEK